MHAFARRGSGRHNSASFARAAAATNGRLRHSHHPLSAPLGTAHPAIQLKPAIARLDDQQERLAERAAEQIARVSEPPLERACACGGGCPRCRTERDDAEHASLQANSVRTADAGLAPAPPIVSEVLGSSGDPIEPTTRDYMERRFGRDFAGVRVHSDGRAGESALALNARGYTVGLHIVFAPGQYAPATAAGRRLVAHELAHVVQQETSSHGATVQRQPYDPQSQQVEDMDTAAEREYANSGAPKAQTCGRPSWCPPGFCEPYKSQKLAEYYRSKNGPWIMAGIAAAVDSRVVPFWQEYLAGGSPPKNITPAFAKDFTNSPTTNKATTFLINELKSSLTAKMPAVATTASFDIKSLIPTAVDALNGPISKDRMNFSIPRDIPGNLAGDIGVNQTLCKSGAQPSPFDDERRVSGTVELARTSASEITVSPLISYTVKDTVDLCPGDCGTRLEQVATVPLSQFEATGISGDVPFTVEFPAPWLGPFTIAVPKPPSTAAPKKP